MLLVVDDDVAALRALDRLLGDRQRLHAASADEARAALARMTELTGCLIDVSLPEGPRAGLGLLEGVRETHPDVPCALVTGSCEPDVVNFAGHFRAAVIIKPATTDLLAWILEQVDRPSAEDLPHTVAAAARVRFSLTARETEVVAWFVAGRDGASYLAHTGMSRSTFKTHRTSILAKARQPSLEMLASHLLRAEAARRQ